MARGRSLGLIDDPTWRRFEHRQQQVREVEEGVGRSVIRPTEEVVERLEAAGIGRLSRPTTVLELLSRPEVTWTRVAEALALPELPSEVAEQLEVDAKYGGYIRRAERRADLTRSMDAVVIPRDVDWLGMDALSREVRERLNLARPETLGQVGRLPGITPAAVGVVAAWLARPSA
jgi:tRNA uridine 5-carboxymethylaminomethyl modification enzyme